MSSGRQDLTKGLKNSPYLSCVRPRLSRARIFASSSSYNAGKSVLERPVAAFLITIDSKSFTWICTSRSLPKRSCSWAIAFGYFSAVAGKLSTTRAAFEFETTACSKYWNLSSFGRLSSS
ncbi:hypothetical protein TNCV_4345101 [Trichonephila clavipes]|nr:hypothetical protein TNCV_4345101 [Trichonephila clavipes]